MLKTVRVRRLLAAMAVAALAVTFVGAPAGADTDGSSSSACSTASAPVETQTFARLLDPNWYFEVPNGGFEHGSTGWTFSGGASVQAGVNQTLLPQSPDDSHALVLPFGASATTATLCVSGTAPTMRLFARQTSILPAAIVVTVTATRPGGLPQILATPNVAVIGGWSSPSELFRLPWLGDGNTQVSITISSLGLSPVQIDDVFVDPLRQR